MGGDRKEALEAQIDRPRRRDRGGRGGAGRVQGNVRDEPSVHEDALDDQITAVPSRFAVAKRERARMVNAWRRHQSAAVDTAAARIRIRRRLERLRELYLDGDLDKAAYQAHKAAGADRMAALSSDGTGEGDAGTRLAAFLADAAAAWRAATPAERNRLSRQRFASEVVSNGTAVAVVPRQDLRPFFGLVAV